MDENLRLDWSVLEKLIPLCLEFKRQHDCGNAIDLHDAAMQVGQAFGIQDIDAFAVAKAKDGLKMGFGQAFGDNDSEELAAFFASLCKPVMKVVFEYAKGNMNPEQFMDHLNKACLEKCDVLQTILQNSLGIPNEAANMFAKQLGPYAISLYCFIAVYKVYQRAALDAELAKERRIEIERMTNEAIAQMKEQRAEMEQLVSRYLLDRLLPFGESMAAIDQAILNNDDEGFIAANVELWSLFDRDAQYRSAAEFENLMLSDEVFRL